MCAPAQQMCDTAQLMCIPAHKQKNAGDKAASHFVHAGVEGVPRPAVEEEAAAGQSEEAAAEGTAVRAWTGTISGFESYM